jgi:hypothetical protein
LKWHMLCFFGMVIFLLFSVVREPQHLLSSYMCSILFANLLHCPTNSKGCTPSAALLPRLSQKGCLKPRFVTSRTSPLLDSFRPLQIHHYYYYYYYILLQLLNSKTRSAVPLGDILSNFVS